jgi:hypothetical protein
VIVFPVRTERTPASPFERAVEVRPVGRLMIDEKQLRDVVRSHVHPSVRELDVRMYPSPHADKVVVAIVIPEQHEGDKPFLVLSPIGSGGEKIQGWLLGLPVRVADETEHMRAEEVHELISRGLGLAARVEELATILAHQAPAPAEAPSETAWQRARMVADRYVGELNAWDGRRLPPVLILTAVPLQPTGVPTLFRDEGVRGVIERPPITREQGWNLGTLGRAELVEGSRLEVRSGGRKLLDLGEDGVFVAVARVENFLSRDRPGHSKPAPHRMNSLALVEFTHDFVLTYQAIGEHLEPPPAEAFFGVAVVAATGSPDGPVFLPPGGVHSLGWELPVDITFPDSSDYVWGYPAEMSMRPGEIAYPLLERVYAFFKQSAEAIPYLNQDRSAVDPETFGS